MSNPCPAGDPVRAFRTALRRAHKAEQHARELQAELDALRATQRHEEQK